MNECKGKNCGSTDMMSHSSECAREHDEHINPDKAVIRKAIERYCSEVRDPRKGVMMITNAADMMEWLLDYDSLSYQGDAPEIFPGTTEALASLKIT